MLDFFGLDHRPDFQQRALVSSCAAKRSKVAGRIITFVYLHKAELFAPKIGSVIALTFYLCAFVHMPGHRTGQSGVLWREWCSSPGLSPKVACFSDPWPPEATRARTLSMTPQCYQSVNSWSGRGIQLSFGIDTGYSLSHTVFPLQTDKGMFQVIEFPNLGPFLCALKLNSSAMLFRCNRTAKYFEELQVSPSSKSLKHKGCPTTLMKS